MKKDILLDTMFVVGVGLMAWGLGVRYGKKRTNNARNFQTL